MFSLFFRAAMSSSIAKDMPRIDEHYSVVTYSRYVLGELLLPRHGAKSSITQDERLTTTPNLWQDPT